MIALLFRNVFPKITFSGNLLTTNAQILNLKPSSVSSSINLFLSIFSLNPSAYSTLSDTLSSFKYGTFSSTISVVVPESIRISLLTPPIFISTIEKLSALSSFFSWYNNNNHLLSFSIIYFYFYFYYYCCYYYYYYYYYYLEN